MALGAAVTLEELETDPHPVLARLREHEPVAWIDVLDGWLVTRRDLVLEAMRLPELYTVDDPRFSTGRVVGRSMLTTDGDEHARHRAPFADPLRLAAVRERFGPIVEAETDALIDAFVTRGRAELRRGLAGPLAARVVTRLLGLRAADTGSVLGWYDAIVASVTGVTAGLPPSAAGEAAFAELRAAVEPELHVDGDLDAGERVSNAAVLMFGGIETTEGMIVNLVLHVLESDVPLDASLLPNAVEESLRLEPAAAVIDRYATRDVELGGTAIRRGDLVRLSLAAANRDPAFFPDPDRFDPARANARHHVAFAHGPHVCVGMHLARLEAQTALARLLERLPGLRLDPAQPVAPGGLVFRKPPELHVLWDYAPSGAVQPPVR
jgi:cytochrome P450